MAPDQDWSWLRQAVARLKAGTTRCKPKLARIRPSADLLRLGFALMAEAEAMAAKRPYRAAARYRDGLMIALLAARPLRLATFAGLRLGTEVVRIGDAWCLRVDGGRTKTGAPVEVPLPAELAAAIERYLDIWRPRLLGRTRLDAFWVTKDGTPMRPHAVNIPICRLTRQAFGVSVNPHLFRDCAATSIAIDDPEHVRIAARVLGHATLATTERYYNQAGALEASRLFHADLGRLRRETATAVGRTARGRQPCGP
jgi:site-specific recombinase XerD